MDFQAAQKAFERIEYLRSTGHLSDEEYRGKLNELRVTDAWGRLWMPQERTGRWHVWHQGQWVPAAPPGMDAPAAPTVESGPAPSAADTRTAATGHQQAAPPARARSGSKLGLYIIIWLVFWSLVAIALLIFVAPKEPMVLAGVGLAALLSLVLMLASMSSQWQGQVVDVRQVRERVRRGDDAYWEDVTYAYIREPSGKTRKMRAMPGWRVGDHLQKRKGEMEIRKL